MELHFGLFYSSGLRVNALLKKVLLLKHLKVRNLYELKSGFILSFKPLCDRPHQGGRLATQGAVPLGEGGFGKTLPHVMLTCVSSAQCRASSLSTVV